MNTHTKTQEEDGVDKKDEEERCVWKRSNEIVVVTRGDERVVMVLAVVVAFGRQFLSKETKRAKFGVGTKQSHRLIRSESRQRRREDTTAGRQSVSCKRERKKKGREREKTEK